MVPVVQGDSATPDPSGAGCCLNATSTSPLAAARLLTSTSRPRCSRSMARLPPSLRYGAKTGL